MVSDLKFGQCVWHCPQQSVACVHCYLFHSSFQHIASADQSTNLHWLMFWGREERWTLVTLNSRPFLINMDCTSTPSLRGGNDEEGEAIKILILRTTIYFPYLSSIQVHWWYSLHTAVQKVPAHSDSPQVQSQHEWYDYSVVMWRGRGVKNSNFNTITSQLQNPPLKGMDMTTYIILSGLKIIRKFNLLLQWHNDISKWHFQPVLWDCWASPCTGNKPGFVLQNLVWSAWRLVDDYCEKAIGMH